MTTILIENVKCDTLPDVSENCKESNGSVANENVVHTNAAMLFKNVDTCKQLVKHVKNTSSGDNITTSSESEVNCAGESNLLKMVSPKAK